jgi:hypothetical protein
VPSGTNIWIRDTTPGTVTLGGGRSDRAHGQRVPYDHRPQTSPPRRS